MEKVVFFDGDCGLCNRSVKWLIRRKGSEKLSFAPLEGETAQKMFPEHLKQYDSIVFFENKRFYVKSKALVRILYTLGKGWTVAGFLLWLIPWFIRDAVYDWIAYRRKRWYQNDSCELPQEHKKVLFLP